MENQNTRKVSAGTRVYYFDINKDRKDQRFISISEIPTDRHPGEKERQRIFIHAEHIGRFMEALQEAVNEIKDGAEN